MINDNECAPETRSYSATIVRSMPRARESSSYANDSGPSKCQFAGTAARIALARAVYFVAMHLFDPHLGHEHRSATSRQTSSWPVRLDYGAHPVDRAQERRFLGHGSVRYRRTDTGCSCRCGTPPCRRCPRRLRGLPSPDVIHGLIPSAGGDPNHDCCAPECDRCGHARRVPCAGSGRFDEPGRSPPPVSGGPKTVWLRPRVGQPNLRGEAQRVGFYVT